MRRFALMSILFMLMSLAGCRHEPTPQELAETTLKEALEALNRGDYDAYLRSVDFGTEMDSAQTAYMKDLLRQHLGWRASERGSVVSIEMKKSELLSDSVYMVYYQYHFSDSTKEVASQKMVRYGTEWKIRLRN